MSSAADPGPSAAPPGPAGRHYRLRCACCGARFRDDGRLLGCPAPHPPALLVTEYRDRRLRPVLGSVGLSRYRHWLPAAGQIPDDGATGLTYRSTRLGRALGLTDLWISFNGYWPERGATLPTGTFKDLEAAAVLARLGEDPGEDHGEATLVVASAGNAAAAFAAACSRLRRRCLIVVPPSGLADLQYAGDLDPCVTVVALTAGADYTDAVALAERICEHPAANCVSTGGATNVARRDGVATVLFSAAERIGRIPDHYVQAVGSGAGGIAVHEAGRRLVADGRFGNRPARLLLSQNAPYTPMVAAWRARRRTLPEQDEASARARIREIAAPVLSTRRPAYSPAGGLFDALTESGGEMFPVTNDGAAAARALVEETEGIDIDPAAAVAAAGLRWAAGEGFVRRGEIVLLNLTGGGRRLRRRSGRLRPVTPALQVDPDEAVQEVTVERVLGLLG